MYGAPAEVKDLTRQDYEKVRKLVYDQAGINLGDQKMQLVRARLGKKVRKLGCDSYAAYIEMVINDKSGRELSSLLDAISTNTTHLFREPRHFDLLAKLLRQWSSDPQWRKRHDCVRIWSAASSSGEEPYSIAMVADDALRGQGGVDFRILATDISTRMLERAKRGVFDYHRVGTVPPQFKQRYLRNLRVDGEECVQAIDDLRRRISFGRFNLMTPEYPFRRGFNVVFCRNVMIYFDKPTQEAVVNKMSRHLHEGGYLLIGHSESLNNLSHPLKYVEPTVYRK